MNRAIVRFGMAGFLFLCAISAVGFVGWVMNLYKIFIGIDSEVTRQMSLRIIGIIVFPLGSIFGFV